MNRSGRRSIGLRMLFVAGLFVTLGACGAEAERGIETMAEAPARTRTITCELDEAAIRTAIQTFELMEGRAPTSIDELVPSVLRDAPAAVTVDEDGQPTLTAAGKAAGCVLSEGGSEVSPTGS